jgi:hypothetical protein
MPRCATHNAREGIKNFEEDSNSDATLVGFEFCAYPQQHVIHPFTGFWFCGELLTAATAVRGDMRLLHVDHIETKMVFLNRHG